MEQINYNLLFRWFVGLSIDDAVWDATVFTKNRDRLLEADVAREFLATLLALPQVKRHLSSDHFSVDGTLLKAWASMKSFQPKDGTGDPPTGGRNSERNFHREKRSNETHESTTDPDAKLYRKGDGQESRLCYMGHVLMENRNGLAVAGDVTQATGTAEREAALTLIDNHRPTEQRITLGADKAYDVVEFVEALRERQVTPHIAINGHLTKTGKTRRTAVDGRITRHPGYTISQVIRKRIEEIFGWTKPIGGLAQIKVRGLAKVQAVFIFAILAYNLIRIPKLLDASS
jgi:IS5 family transposase